VLSRDFPRRALPAIALTTDASLLTARGNDFGFDSVFSRQVEALGRIGDVLFAYSTSGASRNVLAAVQAARRLGMRIVGFTGEDAGQLKGLVDLALCVPAENTAIVQECHTSMGHAIVALAEKYLFDDDGQDRTIS
jgi:D-sedoheptulose 7-phosphate isomerase